MTIIEQEQIVYMVAGEASGDLLGAAVIREIVLYSSNKLKFQGIGGPSMINSGFEAHVNSGRLSVFGYVEVIKRLPELLYIRRKAAREIISNPPDVLVGIDAPDFNLSLEFRARNVNIPTIHLVSPSIWAWRAKKILKIKRAVDHMLCLFPFEVQIYKDAGVKATYIGHPLADIIPLVPDTLGARHLLKIPAGKTVVTVLPGSRDSEVDTLCPIFLSAMRLIAEQRKNIKFLIPAANSKIMDKIKSKVIFFTELDISVLDKQSHTALAAADVVLLASGTATLEAALFKKPMVIAYKVNWLTAKLMLRQQGQIKFFGLPNVLAGKKLVPEFLQDMVTPPSLANAILMQLKDKNQADEIVKEFQKIHLVLKCNAAKKAASIIVEAMRR